MAKTGENKPTSEQAQATSTPQPKPKSAKPRKKPDNRSTLSKVRGFLPVLVILVCAVAFMARVPIGNLSSFGWETISAICPVGALSVLLASKTFVPRILVGLLIAIVLILLFGRAFCSWVCSVPLVQRMLNIRSLSKEDQRQVERERQRKEARRNKAKKGAAADVDPVPADAGSDAVGSAVVAVAAASADGAVVSTLTEDERKDIAREMGQLAGGGCGAHAARVLDSRHLVLGGSLLSAAIFGFPVFCLVCPIGLTFATVYLVLRMFTGQVSLALVIVPAMLILELLVFRKWCYKICPVGALMSLVSLGNRTFRPHVDKARCIVTSTGKKCGKCGTVCPEGIDLHDQAAGMYAMNDCIKCRRCVDACPTKAITMPFLPPKE